MTTWASRRATASSASAANCLVCGRQSASVERSCAGSGRREEGGGRRRNSRRRESATRRRPYGTSLPLPQPYLRPLPSFPPPSSQLPAPSTLVPRRSLAITRPRPFQPAACWNVFAMLRPLRPREHTQATAAWHVCRGSRAAGQDCAARTLPPRQHLQQHTFTLATRCNKISAYKARGSRRVREQWGAGGGWAGEAPVPYRAACPARGRWAAAGDGSIGAGEDAQSIGGRRRATARACQHSKERERQSDE